MSYDWRGKAAFKLLTINTGWEGEHQNGDYIEMRFIRSVHNGSSDADDVRLRLKTACNSGRTA